METSQESKKAVLVIRVSDPKQEKEGLSLDNQELSIREYARDKGLEVVREFRFQETADQKIRTKFQEVIKFIKARKEVVALVGYRVDRLTRNFRDHVAMDDMRLEHGKELHFVHDRLVISKNTVGLAIQQWDTQVYLAKMYINRLKADAEATANFKLSRGEIAGKAPFGYRNIRDENGRSTVALNPERAPIVTRMFVLYASGAHTMNSVRAAIKNEFGVSLSKGRIDHILKNPFYSGKMRYRQKAYPHGYERLVSEATFQQVQERKVSFHKKSFKFAGLPFPYRGLIRCSACGCRVTPEKKIKRGTVYTYYHCTQYNGKHGARWIPETHLTEEFGSVLDRLRIPSNLYQKLFATHQGTESQNKERAEKAIAERLRQVEQYERRKEQMYEDKLDGLISLDYFESQKAKYDEVQSTLLGEIAVLKKSDDVPRAQSSKLLEICQSIGSLFRVAKPVQKRALISLLFQDCFLNEKKLLWELKEPFKTVFSCAESHIWGPLEDLLGSPLHQANVNFEVLSETLAECKLETENEPLLEAA